MVLTRNHHFCSSIKEVLGAVGLWLRHKAARLFV